MKFAGIGAFIGGVLGLLGLSAAIGGSTSEGETLIYIGIGAVIGGFMGLKASTFLGRGPGD